jgi:hypothetical protein
MPEDCVAAPPVTGMPEVGVDEIGSVGPRVATLGTFAAVGAALGRPPNEHAALRRTKIERPIAKYLENLDNLTPPTKLPVITLTPLFL